VAVFGDEGKSGSNGLESRVGLAALATLKAGDAATLIVYRLDRLARDLILQGTLVERLRSPGTPVRSTSEPDLDTDTDDPTKKLIRVIIDAVSEYERAVIRGRMMAGKAAKKAIGGYLGGTVLYGFRLEDGQVIQDEAEQEIGQLVARFASTGASLRTIAAELERAGHARESWHPNTVRRRRPPCR
jgi:DNA invertase Pin-like site-specific DNA recombinase